MEPKKALQIVQVKVDKSKMPPMPSIEEIFPNMQRYAELSIALCLGYDLDDLSKMSLTFKTQIETLKAKIERLEAERDELAFKVSALEAGVAAFKNVVEG